MILEKIKTLITQREIEEALELINQNMGSPQIDDEELMLLKSICLSAKNNFQEAYDALSSIAEHTFNIRIAHKAGELCLILNQFLDSKVHLSKAIELSNQFEDKYYLSTCYLERAYVNLKLNLPLEAKKDLDKVDDDESISWLRGVDFISKEGVLSKI